MSYNYYQTAKEAESIMILSTSKRFKELREKNGYTQAALAAKLSVTEPVLMPGKWEFLPHLLKTL